MVAYYAYILLIKPVNFLNINLDSDSNHATISVLWQNLIKRAKIKHPKPRRAKPLKRLQLPKVRPRRVPVVFLYLLAKPTLQPEIWLESFFYNMKIGRYGPGNTNFSKLKVSHLPIHIFNTTRSSPPGCGASCLSMLTGIRPEVICRKNYTDSFMLKFLRKHNISAYQVNQSNVSNRNIWKYSITDEHVILLSILVKKRESTWLIVYDDKMFHNFELIKTDTYSMFNFPIVTMYILHKQQWE